MAKYSKKVMGKEVEMERFMLLLIPWMAKTLGLKRRC
jgi:hypothetical protein